MTLVSLLRVAAPRPQGGAA